MLASAACVWISVEHSLSHTHAVRWCRLDVSADTMISPSSLSSSRRLTEWITAMLTVSMLSLRVQVWCSRSTERLISRLQCLNKNVPTLSSCNLDMHGLISIFFLANKISALSKMMCRFNFPCPFTFAYFVSF